MMTTLAKSASTFFLFLVKKVTAYWVAVVEDQEMKLGQAMASEQQS